MVNMDTSSHNLYVEIYMLVVELDYLFDLKVCFSPSLTPFPNEGVWGCFPPTNFARVVQGGDNFCIPP